MSTEGHAGKGYCGYGAKERMGTEGGPISADAVMGHREWGGRGGGAGVR